MGAYARWRALSREEQRLALKSAAVIAVAAASLRVVGVERTLRIASRPVRLAALAQGRPVRLAALAQGRPVRLAALAQGRPVEGHTNVIGDVVAAVDRAGRYVPGGTCLSKSLALAWLLRRRGIDARVCIGTRKDNGRFEAHAWVEAPGVVINHAPPGYAALVHSLQFTVHSRQFRRAANREPKTVNRQL